MDPSRSTDRRYIGFNSLFPYMFGTYAASTIDRYLRDGARYRVHGGELFGTGTYVRYLIHKCFTI